jgi:ribosome-associated protein
VSEPETIRLGQALKLAGVVSTGGEAKYLIQHGYVQVNGEVETRRKRQLHPGDTVTVGGQTFVIGLDDSPPSQGAGP